MASANAHPPTSRPPRATVSIGGGNSDGAAGGREPLRRAVSATVPSALQPSRQPSDPLASELTDSLQLATQTLLQIAPPHILDPARERLSSSSVSVPTPSLSALLAITKILNYVATNLCPNAPLLAPPRHTQFDVSELLQTVGDIASAFASHSGVDIVLSHSEVASRSVLVSADECGLAYLLSHVLRRVIQTAANGDTIEISCSLKPSEEGTFDITHRASGTPVLATFSHGIFQTGLGLLKARISASALESQGRKYQLLVPLKAPESNSGLAKVLEEEASAQPFPHVVLASEPTSTELSGFAESLRGTKVALHASSSTPFAQCLTANLTAWGMEITHLSTDKGNIVNNTQPNDESAASSSEASSTQTVELAETLPRFIIIDEDVEELRRRTLMFRRSPVNMHASRRPPLIHRPKSHHRGAEAGASHNLLPAPTIIFFTSLTKYNVVRDAVQNIEVQTLQSGLSVPEIFALPKPVGTRRFLTALFAAFNKPLLDPLFAPIATSPSTPPALNPFLDSGSNKSRTPPETRSRTERTPTRSPREVAGFHPHSAYPGSPLAMEVDTAEYFQQTDAHALGQTPSSGMLIQSPDGQPAGIFFKPPTSKPSRHSSSGNGSGVKFSDSKEVSGTRNDGPSIETLRRSTRHLSDEFPIVKSVPHPFTFLRSKTTPQLPGALPHASGTPAPMDGSQRWRPGSSSVSDNGSSRVESTQDANQTQTLPQDDHLPSQSVDPTKRVASPPRARSSLETRKASSPGIFKLADNTIVPPINVLIVEDNPINQTILTTFMKRKKIKYGTAKDGQEAIDKYKSGNYHLILMDIQMPVMDGIEATRQIRQLEAQAVGMPEITHSPGNKTTPLRSPGFRSSVIIVALTASSLQSDRVNALAAGCNDFLTKPVSLVWLNNKIIEWGSLKALQMYAAVAPTTPPANSDLTVSPDTPHFRDENSVEAKVSSVPHQGLPVPSRTSDSGAQPSNGALHNRRASHGSASSEEDNSLGSSDDNPPAARRVLGT